MSTPTEPAPQRPFAFYRENARFLGAGFGLSFLSSFGQTFFISLFAGEIRADYGLTDGEWGALYTLATLGSAATLFQAGALADRMRLDRLAVVVLLAYGAVAATMALGGAMGGGLWLLALTVYGLRLCGQGMMSHLAITAMGRWFRAHRGRAVAFAGLGFSVGEAALPAVGVALAAWIGWRETWGLVALLLVFLAAPTMGWVLAGGRTPKGADAAEPHAGRHGRHWDRRAVLSDWAFWALLPAVLAPPFIGTVLFFHQVHIAEVKGWSLAAMAAGYPVYAGLTVVAVLFGGGLVDRIGPLRLLPVFLLPMAVGSVLLAPVTALWGWLAVLALAGVTQGLAQALWGALWPELYGTRHLGAVRAMATTAMVFSTAAGPGITGLLIDVGIDYPAQSLWLGGVALGVSVLGIAVLRRLQTGRAGG
ncbi:MAG: MFS transporter [Pikeienuella sp.]